MKLFPSLFVSSILFSQSFYSTTSSTVLSGSAHDDFFNELKTTRLGGFLTDSFGSKKTAKVLEGIRTPRYEKLSNYNGLSVYRLFSERERMSFFGEYSEQRTIEGLIKNKFIPRSLSGYIKQKFEEADQVYLLYKFEQNDCKTVLLNDFKANELEAHLVLDRKFWFDLL